MAKSSYPLVERKISEITEEDKVVEVHAHIIREKPFIIDDGSGRALVTGVSSFKEGHLIRVIAKVNIREGNTLRELDPIVIADINNLDLELYSELKNIKGRLVIRGRDGK